MQTVSPLPATLVTGCRGICEYCYLNTNLGAKPYTRIYINIEEILQQAAGYIEKRRPEATVFEASAVGDPLPVEELSGALADSIRFFAAQESGYLRVATKFPCPPEILNLDHRGHTRIRYSINTQKVISRYEHRTPSLTTRLAALQDLIRHGYPSGIILAPVFLETNWHEEYGELLEFLSRELALDLNADLTFEIISHRFTSKARRVIEQVFPAHNLPMDEERDRKFKYGQFGYGKYIYDPVLMAEMKEFFSSGINRLFPEARVEYII